MNFNVNGVVFRNIFVLHARLMLGIILGVKQYANYEHMIVEWISRRFGGDSDNVSAVMGCFTPKSCLFQLY